MQNSLKKILCELYSEKSNGKFVQRVRNHSAISAFGAGQQYKNLMIRDGDAKKFYDYLGHGSRVPNFQPAKMFRRMYRKPGRLIDFRVSATPADDPVGAR